jgi:hypothetical protein
MYNTRAANVSPTPALAPIIAEKPKTEIDPTFLPLIQSLNMQAEGLKIEFVEAFPLDDQQTGEFDGLRTIKILRNGEAKLSLSTTLAHEYLHYIWASKLSQAERDSLSANLTQLYSADPGMQERMTHYRDFKKLVPGTEQFSNELHSIYCTESSDGWLDQAVLDECNKWISRGALSFQR